MLQFKKIYFYDETNIKKQKNSLKKMLMKLTRVIF